MAGNPLQYNPAVNVTENWTRPNWQTGYAIHETRDQFIGERGMVKGDGGSGKGSLECRGAARGPMYATLATGQWAAFGEPESANHKFTG